MRDSGAGLKINRHLGQETCVARPALILAIALGLAAGVAVVGQARLLSQAISQVFLGGQDLAGVSRLLLFFLLLSLGRAGLVWGSEVSAYRLADRVKRDLRNRLAAHLLALGPAYARGERSGELANTLVEGIEALDAYYRQYLPQLALAALVPLAVFFFVLPLDWVSGLVLFLTAPLIPIFMILIGNAAEALTRKQWTALSRMSAHFLDVLQGLATLKMLGRSREQIRAIARISDRFREATMGVLRVTFLSALVLELVATLSTAVVAVQVGLRLLYGRLSFEEALFVLILAPEFYLPLRLLGGRFHAGMQGVAAARRIFEILARRPEVEVEIGTVEPRLPGLASYLEFEDVHYAYDDGQRPALDGVSFRIAAGERVALVGPSGAGKSTVAYLLLRFVEPERGTISVDGRLLRDLAPAAWRQKVAWLPQEPALFYGTVAENIRLARPAADDGDVIRAARQAGAHEFVQALPQGYETLVGERGARLSGGEVQRIALARAFLKDAPFLVLDEPAASLDPEVENLVEAALGRLLEGRTALIIAHRLNTVSRAGRILAMDGGRIVEAGSHAALLAQKGLYARLVGAYGGEGAA